MRVIVCGGRDYGRRSWTPSEVESVRAAYRSGMDDADIGSMMGRSAGAVSSCRQLHKIRRPLSALKRAPVWSVDEIADARQRYARGESLAAIGQSLGRSRIAMKRAVTTHGLKRDPNLCAVDLSVFDTADETWKTTSVSASYAVSSTGRVMSLFPGRIGEMLSHWVDQWGYRHVTLSLHGRSKRCAIHRLVALAFIGDPPSAVHQVAHNDGKPSNNSVHNLRWATPKENQADRVIHGTSNHKRGVCVIDVGA